MIRVSRYYYWHVIAFFCKQYHWYVLKWFEKKSRCFGQISLFGNSFLIYRISLKRSCWVAWGLKKMCYTCWDKGWDPVCGWSLMVLGLVVTCCEIKTDDKLKFIGTLLSKLLGKKLVCNFSLRTSLVFNSVVACFVFVVSHTLSWLLSGDNSSLLYGVIWNTLD